MPLRTVIDVSRLSPYRYAAPCVWLRGPEVACPGTRRLPRSTDVAKKSHSPTHSRYRRPGRGHGYLTRHTHRCRINVLIFFRFTVYRAPRCRGRLPDGIPGVFDRAVQFTKFFVSNFSEPCISSTIGFIDFDPRCEIFVLDVDHHISTPGRRHTKI